MANELTQAPAVHVWLVYYDRAEFYGSFVSRADASDAVRSDPMTYGALGLGLSKYGLPASDDSSEETAKC